MGICLGHRTRGLGLESGGDGEMVIPTLFSDSDVGTKSSLRRCGLWEATANEGSVLSLRQSETSHTECCPWGLRILSLQSYKE